MTAPVAPARPRLYYGWVLIAVLGITETVSYGIVYYTFSVFLTSMEAEFGWSRATLTGAFALSLLTLAVMAYPVGVWVDRHGARLLMTVGSVLATLLMIAWALVTDQTLFYLIWIGLGVCGSLIFYETAFAVVARWFDRRRSSALAMITFAAGFASTVFVPLADALMVAYGWRTAVLILAGVLGVVTIPLHALFLRRSPADIGIEREAPAPRAAHIPPQRDWTLGEVLHSRFFWVLLIAFSVAGMAAATIRFHFIPFLIAAGVGGSIAAYASGGIGIMQVVGRLVFAPIERRLSVKGMVIGVFAAQTVGIALLVFTPAILAVGGFVVVFGASHGAMTLVRPAILSHLYGVSHYGRIASIIAMPATIAGTVMPLAAGLLYDRFGNYDLVLSLVIVFSAVAAVGLWLAGRQTAKPAVTPLTVSDSRSSAAD